MWIFGLLLLVAAAGLFYGYITQKRRLSAMQATDMVDVAHLRQVAESMTAGVGAGSLLYRAEVKGKVVCDAPLDAELTGSQCIYYAMKVEREYEETYYTTDQQGRRVRQTRRASEVVASNTRSVPFAVQDATGQMPVEPDGAHFVAEKVLSRFEQNPGHQGGVLRMGQWSIAVPTSLGQDDRRTLGYRYEEEAIRVGSPIYVLGEATDRHGELRLLRPHDDGEFIVSVKSEEELARQGKRSMIGMLIGAIACAIIGIGMIIAEVF